MPNPDDELLHAYATDRSQAAFAQLVERHLPLVWSAACRVLHDPHRSQDIAQQVFTILARKAARLNSHVVLSGWLYRTTIHLSQRALRTERRRQHREEAAVIAMKETTTEQPWQVLAPLLDEAMSVLREQDRNAVVLRYFENKSLVEVGTALRVSENAAQKRLERAVEKLRKFFAKRGKIINATTLIAALSAGAVQPAPAMLATAISTAALACATTLTSTLGLTTTIKLMSTVKPILTAGAIITAVVGIVIQHHQKEELLGQNNRLRTEIESVETSTADLSNRLQRVLKEREEDPRQLELSRLRAQASRLQNLESELTRLRVDAASPGKSLKSPAEKEELQQQFDAQRAFQVNGMKLLGLQLRVLEGNNNLAAALGDDGKLNPDLLTNTVPSFDLKKVELLLTNQTQLSKLLDYAPGTIVARSAEAISTPDGRWLRLYVLADGSVQTRVEDDRDEAFDTDWKLVHVIPKP